MKFVFSIVLLFSLSSQASVETLRFDHVEENLSLRIEVLNDTLVHFEMGSTEFADRWGEKKIYTTAMVFKKDHMGPTVFSRTENGFRTKVLEVEVDGSLCITTMNLSSQKVVNKICASRFEQALKRVYVESPGSKNFYGLGHIFYKPGADGDLKGRYVTTRAPFGNALRYFEKGANSNALFPILYALGSTAGGYSLFLDHVYKQDWAFKEHNAQTPFIDIDTYGDQIRWYLNVESSVQMLKRNFMELTGKAPVPPKKAMGIWVSEFGFDSFEELFQRLGSLRRVSFPVDGFGMDIQWFGGRFFMGGGWEQSTFGSLHWDRKNFPNPEQTIKHLKEVEGVDLMLIEESYVSEVVPFHRELADRGLMAKNSDGTPAYLDANPWWGKGGMLDWSNPQAGNYFHDQKRQPLVDMGINFHWTDLGEPEMFDSNAFYYGYPELGKHRHADIHNMYNYFWLESISRGYQRHDVENRPFMMSRSGAVGMQRTGTGMWSGDIAANFAAFTASMNVQMHLSLSGVDYYGSDIGGFHRRPDTLDGDENILFTQWFANASVFDFPVRSHTWNLSNQLKTSPSEIGHFRSNLVNARQRYQLSPYYYSLAHQISESGDPLVRPLFYEFENDLKVREMGNQKMIGPDLMAAVVANYGETDRRVYLPRGKWINYHTLVEYESSGQVIEEVPAHQNGVFRIPLFIREGAILPMMSVDQNTLNILGQRKQGSAALDDLRLRIYPSSQETVFDLIEDDGVTIDYKKGKKATTRVSQKSNGGKIRVTVDETKGDYEGMKDARNTIVEILSPKTSAVSVSMTGIGSVEKCRDEKQLRERACYLSQESSILVSTGERSVRSAITVEIDTQERSKESTAMFFVCHNGVTRPGESIYITGDVNELGAWDPSKALRLKPVEYPIWSGYIEGLPQGRVIKWRCLKRREVFDGQILQESQIHQKQATQEPYSGRAGNWF